MKRMIKHQIKLRNSGRDKNYDPVGLTATTSTTMATLPRPPRMMLEV